MTELDAFLTDPQAITDRLTELAAECHLVSPSTNVDAPIPDGHAVSITFVRVDPRGSDVIGSYERNGKLVLSAKKMQEIGAAAGLSWDAEKSGKRDTLTHPHYVEFRAVGVLKNFDGSERTVMGEVVIDLREGAELTHEVLQRAVQSGEDPFVALRQRRMHILAEAETRAQARAVANGLGLHRDYDAAELAKPFAIARLVWTGQSEDPIVRAKLAEVTAARALGAGRALFDTGSAPLGVLRFPETTHKYATQPGGDWPLLRWGSPSPAPVSVVRIAFVADTHADGEEGGRLDEHDEIMDWIGRDAAARGCTGFVHAGDVWERRSTSRERLAVADWLGLWSQYGPIIVLRGNHDDEGDIELLGRLRSWKSSITAVTKPGVYHLLQDHCASVAVACLPWPQKASLLAQLPDATRAGGDQAATNALRDVLRGLGDKLQGHPGPRIFAGHVMMRGSKSGLGQPPLIGCDYEFGVEDLALVRASFYGLGHIHTAQEWDVMGVPAAYIASPRRNNFGELDPKCYVVVEFEGSKLKGWERVPTPCAPMLHLDGSMAADCLDVDMDSRGWNVRGADVRFRYSVPVDRREQAAAEAQELRDHLLSGGARSVKLEEVVLTERRARAPEVAAARTLPDRVERHWAARGFDPGERRAPLLEKTAWLELEGA